MTFKTCINATPQDCSRIYVNLMLNREFVVSTFVTTPSDM